MALANGQRFGPYTVIEPLGKGGMASVYKVYEPGLDRYVALKVLPPEFLHDETFAERFKREAKAVAKLEHPNIVPIYAFGIEQGMPWMAMRLVPGGALASVVKRGRLEPARAVGILKGTADALTYAHGKGVVHRDVKPQNVLLDEHERVYLADFGIAKMLEGGGKLTATGMISGTPQYMAPEQATATTVDGRADTYALGIVAYELLTGRVPFAADTPVAILMKHVQEPIPLPSPDEVKEPLVRAILKALAKKAEDRWATPAAFVAALEGALHESGPALNLPTLPLTSVLPEVASPTARTAVPTATRPAVPERPPVATRPPAGPRPPATLPTRPARTAAPGEGTAVPPPERSRSTATFAALGFGGAVALALAGAVAFFLVRRGPNPDEVRATPTPLPSGVSVAAAASPPAPLAAAPPSLQPAASTVPAPSTAPAASREPIAARPTPSAPPPTTQPPARPAPSLPAATVPPTTLPPAPAPAGPSPEVERLMAALTDRTIEARWKAAESLGNLGDEASPAVAGLVQGLQDRSEVVRWRSAEAIGKIGAAGALAPLAAALKDRDALVRTEAAKALGLAGPRGKEAVPALSEALSDSDVYCRRQVAKTLLALAPESRAAIPALTQALKDKDKFVRLQSAKALGQIGPEARAADAALQAASKDSEPLVARAATEALRRIAGQGGSATQED